MNNKKLIDQLNKPVNKKTEERAELLFLFLFFLVAACVMLLTGCAPNEEMACSEPTPFVCSNTCDGLYAYQENTRVLFFETAVDCAHMQNIVHIEEGFFDGI